MVCEQRSSRPKTGRGFTLVELLVVIAIIGVIAALLAVAVSGALSTAQEGQVALEMANLEAAMERFRTKYGAYPPDFVLATADSGTLGVNGNVYQINALMASNSRARSPNDSYPAFANLDPSEALFFWLGGEAPDPLSQFNGGITEHPQFPITSHNSPTPNTPAPNRASAPPPLFDFVKTRLRDADADGFLEYYPPNSEKPYVYFSSKYYQAAYNSDVSILGNNGPNALFSDPSAIEGRGVPVLLGTNNSALTYARPYAESQPNGDVLKPDGISIHFANPTGVQIIAAGDDGAYGSFEYTARQTSPQQRAEILLSYAYPAGPYSTSPGLNEHDDNITNFARGTLEAAKP